MTDDLRKLLRWAIAVACLVVVLGVAGALTWNATHRPHQTDEQKAQHSIGCALFGSAHDGKDCP